MEKKEQMCLNLVDLIILSSPVAVSFLVPRFVSSCAKKYCLHKEFKAKKNASIKLPPKIPKLYTNINKKRMLRRKYGEEVLKFANMILAKMPKENLTIFYNNLNSLDISLSEERMKKYTLAYYNCRENKIYIREKYGEKTLYHELFHMISSYYDKFNKHFYSGFSLSTEEYCVAKSLNEGYTQLMTERYNDKEEIVSSYVYEKAVANMFEFIVGKEKMEHLYMTANLYGLIEEFKKYVDEQDILNIFAEIDYVSEGTGEKFITPLEHYKLERKAQNINNFLVYCATKKILNELSNEKITPEEAAELLGIFINNYCIHVLDTKFSEFKCLNVKEVNKFIEKGFLSSPEIEYVIKYKKNC